MAAPAPAADDYRDRDLGWTALSLSMGYTTRQQDRAEILTAAATMPWTPTTTWQAHVDSTAACAVLAATTHITPGERCLIGTVEMPRGRRIIGLQTQGGTRRYVVTVGCEAIHVLTETRDHPHCRPSRVA